VVFVSILVRADFPSRRIKQRRMRPSRTFGGVTRYRWFESGSLQRRVHCEPDFRGASDRTSRCSSPKRWRQCVSDERQTAACGRSSARRRRIGNRVLQPARAQDLPRAGRARAGLSAQYPNHSRHRRQLVIIGFVVIARWSCSHKSGARTAAQTGLEWLKGRSRGLEPERSETSRRPFVEAVGQFTHGRIAALGDVGDDALDSAACAVAAEQAMTQNLRPMPWRASMGVSQQTVTRCLA